MSRNRDKGNRENSPYVEIWTGSGDLMAPRPRQIPVCGPDEEILRRLAHGKSAPGLYYLLSDHRNSTSQAKPEEIVGRLAHDRSLLCGPDDEEILRRLAHGKSAQGVCSRRYLRISSSQVVSEGNQATSSYLGKNFVEI